MNRKIIFPLILVITMIAVVFSQTDMTIAQKEPQPFEFNQNMLITIRDSGDKSEFAKKMTIKDEKGKDIRYILNELSNGKFAISPVDIASGKCSIENIENYTAEPYDGIVYVQNKDNLSKISDYLNEKAVYPVLYDAMDVDAGAGLEKAAEAGFGVNVKDEAKESSEDYTNTNLQDKDVEESDIIKTDGEYIYYVSNDKIYIIKTTKGKMDIVSSIDFGASYKDISDLYLKDEKLIAVFGRRIFGTGGDYKQTGIMVYSLENKIKPKLISSTNMDGYASQTRLVGGKLYIIGYKAFDKEYIDEDKDPVITSSQNAGAKSTLKAKIAYPHRSSKFRLVQGGENLSKMIYLPANPSEAITTLTAFDINSGNRQDISYMGNSENMYMNKNNAYIYFENYYDNETDEAGKTVTTISRFSLGNGVNYTGSVKVKGNLLSRYAMYEDGGNLFVSYTDSESKSNAVASFDANLIKVGSIDGLATGENIHSVRYAADRLYLVTFKQVDPLFAIDISNPASMKVLGYIKMPGYSEYLHPLDGGLLFGLGQNTKVENDGNVVTNGLKISLYDVNDEKDIKILDEKIIGDKGSYSDLSYEPRALMDYKEKSMLGFPAEITRLIHEKNKNGEPYESQETEFSGALVYQIKNKKLNLYMQITHDDKKEKIKGNYDKQINRLIAIGDSIYSFSPQEARSFSLSDKKEISKVQLYQKENFNNYIE